jgi:hypothetical protein
LLVSGCVVWLFVQAACSASGGDSAGASAAGGIGGTSTGGSSGTGTGGSGNIGGLDAAQDSTLTQDAACAQFSEEAREVPVATMIVLDRSTSMTEGGKWAAAQQAIVQAIDSDGFDHLDLGLQAYPAAAMPGPACLPFPLPVDCGVTSLPQVQLADTATQKSTAGSGPRKYIRDWLAANPPFGSATPGYEAMKAGYSALQLHPINGSRALILITDGGFTCATTGSPPRKGYVDSIGCEDWEHPDNVIDLISTAYADTSAPVRTFIIGVPGSATHKGDPEAPPYAMRLALSAFAYAGSPTSVPPACDGTSFTDTAGDPSVSCHFDLTVGTFDAQALADTLTEIRSKTLGCKYQVPDDDGGASDPTRVNVNLSTDGSEPKTLPKRSDSQDACANDGCWDYDADGNIELIGKSCADVKDNPNAKIQILVGCETVVK